MFTDTDHHLIRESVWIEKYGFERIGMSRISLGYLFYIFSKAIGLWGLGLLIHNYRKGMGIQLGAARFAGTE